MRRFRSFAGIDWSGAAGERLPGLAVAVADAGSGAPRLIDPGSGWSRAAVRDWLQDQAAADRDLLVGIDFTPALPFADAAAYFPGWPASPPHGPALWAMVDHACADAPHLAAGPFLELAEAARHYRLAGRGTGDRFVGGLGRLRMVEARCRAAGSGAAQSAFNLVGPAQVGKSALTGMRLLHQLRGIVPIWPFDPVPPNGPLIVETYSALAARAAGRRAGRTKLRDPASLDAALVALGSDPLAAAHDEHQADALLIAAWLRHAGATAALWHPAGLTAALARTEGWTFGVA